jgi:lipoate-protein ligase A
LCVQPSTLAAGGRGFVAPSSTESPGIPPAHDAVMRHEEGDRQRLEQGEPSVHVSVVDAPAISAGISVDPQSPALRRARARGLPVTRRTTGGSIVLARPGDLLWSVVVPLPDPDSRSSFLHAYGKLGSGVVEWLRTLGVAALWSDPLAHSTEFCLLGPRGSVLTVEGRVLGGAAQHATSRALLHHGLLVRTVDRGELARLFRLTPELLLRTVTSLEEVGVARPSIELAHGLEAAISTALPVR